MNFIPNVLCTLFTLKDPVIKPVDKVQISHRAFFTRVCQITKATLLSCEISSPKNKPDSFHILHNGFHGMNQWSWIKFCCSSFKVAHARMSRDFFFLSRKRLYIATNDNKMTFSVHVKITKQTATGKNKLCFESPRAAIKRILFKIGGAAIK